LSIATLQAASYTILHGSQLNLEQLIAIERRRVHCWRFYCRSAF